VLVSLHHLFRLVSHPSVNQTLIDTLCGTVRRKAMPQHMPSPHSFPLGSGQCPFQVIIGLSNRQWPGGPTFGLAQGIFAVLGTIPPIRQTEPSTEEPVVSCISDGFASFL
jgi:hypothetical protein